MGSLHSFRESCAHKLSLIFQRNVAAMRNQTGGHVQKPRRGCPLWVKQRKTRCDFLAFGLVLPVLPLYIIDFQVTGNGRANGWEKIEAHPTETGPARGFGVHPDIL